ncbi:hypothetical protein [Roseovarius sp. MMSF_3350]|uniref:hypothetical protein n=1 Tax=Roseovarius sp. MMSF_3350 TaxID=3046706 RepID=UPI00273F7F7D|nr:hypothetical protein [Roseovarius sp. MMSF_3350]
MTNDTAPELIANENPHGVTTIRDFMVLLVDAMRGYTCEFSADPEQHKQDYDYFDTMFAECFSRSIASQRDEAVGAMVEGAAHLVESAFACRSCGKVFLPSDPHTDEDCPKDLADWDVADPEQVAEAIRALTPSDATAALETRDARVWDAAIEAAVQKHEELWRETDAYKRDQIRALKKGTPDAP